MCKKLWAVPVFFLRIFQAPFSLASPGQGVFLLPKKGERPFLLIFHHHGRFKHGKVLSPERKQHHG
jgi:hypothetical protein